MDEHPQWRQANLPGWGIRVATSYFTTASGSSRACHAVRVNGFST